MEILKKVLNQASWQIAAKGVTATSTFIILSIVSRNFGEYQTGIFTLALTYISFFVLAVDFGINAHLLPGFIKKIDEGQWRKLLGFRLNLAAFLVALAFLIILLPYFFETEFKVLVLLGLGFSVFQTAITASANVIFQAKLQYRFAAMTTSLGLLSTLAAVFLIQLFWPSLFFIMVGYVIGWSITIVISLFFVKKFIKVPSPIFDGTFAIRLVKESWPISLTILFNVFYFRIDSFVLAFFKGFQDVGVYNLAYQVFQAILVLPTFLMNSYYPLMLKHFQDDKRFFIKNLYHACIVMAAFSIVVSIVTFLLAPFIIYTLSGGNGFEGSVTALQLLSLSFPSFFVSSILMWTFITLKQYKKMLTIYILGLVINLLLNIIFIPRYSFVAAAVITNVCEYIILLLQILILRKQLKYA